MTPCILVACHQGLGEDCCFQLYSRTMQTETFLFSRYTTRRHTPEDSNLQYWVPVVSIIRATWPAQHHVVNLLTPKYKLRSACVRARAYYLPCTTTLISEANTLKYLLIYKCDSLFPSYLVEKQFELVRGWSVVSDTDKNTRDLASVDISRQPACQSVICHAQYR